MTDPIAQDEDTISDDEKLDAIMACPELYESGLLFAEATTRPLTYPRWVFVLFLLMNDVYLSNRKASSSLNYSVWRRIRRKAKKRGYPLPRKPPSRTWFAKTRERHLTDDVKRGLDDLLLTMGLSVAQETGLLDAPDVILYGDGKVQTPRYSTSPGDMRWVTSVVDGEPVKIRVPVVNCDPTAKTHWTGDHKQVHGNKFVMIYLRGGRTHERVTLGVEWVPDDKGQHNSEMDLGMGLMRRTLACEQRISDVNWDTAMKGVHRNEVQRDYGVNTHAPITAKSVNPKTDKRVEKARHLRFHELTYNDGTTEEVDLWYEGGWVCQRIVLDDGTTALERLTHRGHKRTRNHSGGYRMNVIYDLPCPRGGPPHTIYERTWNTAEDDACGLNRPENILLSPPGSGEHQRLYGRRSDSETVNNMSDKALDDRKARSLGGPRQALDRWAFAFVTNAICRKKYSRRRQALAA